MQVSSRRVVLAPVLVLALSASIVAGTGCALKSPVAPTSSVNFSSVDLKLGSNATAGTGSTLTVNYTAWLYDPAAPGQKGLQFDTSIGRTPFTFQLGAGQVIPGWEFGLLGMQEGGVRRLVVPPSSVYGESRTGPIPPYSTLVFEVELVSILDITQAAASASGV